MHTSLTCLFFLAATPAITPAAPPPPHLVSGQRFEGVIIGAEECLASDPRHLLKPSDVWTRRRPKFERPRPLYPRTYRARTQCVSFADREYHRNSRDISVNTGARCEATGERYAFSSTTATPTSSAREFGPAASLQSQAVAIGSSRFSFAHPQGGSTISRSTHHSESRAA